MLPYQLNHFIHPLKQKVAKKSPLLKVNKLHICYDNVHYICFVVSKINVTDDNVLTELDVKEKFPHKVQSVPSTSDGKFYNIHVAIII